MGRRNLEKSQALFPSRNLVILIVAPAILVLNGCQRDSQPHPEISASSPQKVVAGERKQTLPHCPEAPYPMLQAKDSATGHHRVFLKWYANTSPRGSGPEELGYCLYRTQKPGRAKDCPKKYPKCEQVNVVPIRGTRCVDELVKDNNTYYYVAIAITSTDTSTTSEEAVAEVPVGEKRNPPPPDAVSYPRCRMPGPPNQAPGR